jgi:hypothetical protein
VGVEATPSEMLGKEKEKEKIKKNCCGFLIALVRAPALARDECVRKTI